MASFDLLDRSQAEVDALKDTELWEGDLWQQFALDFAKVLWQFFRAGLFYSTLLYPVGLPLGVSLSIQTSYAELSHRADSILFGDNGYG